MATPKVTDIANNAKRIEIDIEASRVAVVLHSNLDFVEVANKAVEEMEQRNYQILLTDASAQYKEDFEAELVDGSLSAWGREAELVAWLLARPGYENAKQKADRIEAERLADEEDLAAAEEEEAAAEDELTGGE